MEIITANSSNGHVAFEDTSGKIHCIHVDAGCSLPSIVLVDVDEWKRHYGRTDMDAAVDILDIGYWYTREDGERMYEPPYRAWETDEEQSVDSEKESFRAVVEAVIDWAAKPGRHGGNPYSHEFVRMAYRALGIGDEI